MKNALRMNIIHEHDHEVNTVMFFAIELVIVAQFSQVRHQ